MSTQIFMMVKINYDIIISVALKFSALTITIMITSVPVFRLNRRFFMMAKINYVFSASIITIMTIRVPVFKKNYLHTHSSYANFNHWPFLFPPAGERDPPRGIANGGTSFFQSSFQLACNHHRCEKIYRGCEKWFTRDRQSCGNREHCSRPEYCI